MHSALNQAAELTRSIGSVRGARQDTSDMGRGEAASNLILHGSDQKELESTRLEIVSIIE